jgi:hypothetical protein
LTAELDGVDLRYVRLGEVEIVRRLFAAIRDDAWGTVPPQLAEVQVEAGERSFRVSFEALHEAGALRFRWRGELTGSEDGTVECRMTGVAERDFRYNRIGFCVLHPRENAGCQYRAWTPEGRLDGALPELIGPQRSEGGRLYPLFPSYDALEIDVADGITARFEFEGDLFEMEDQRNWTDASFKTYSTPIALGFPHQAAAGQGIGQVVRLRVDQAAAGEGAIRIELGRPAGEPPPFGLALPSDGAEHSERELELLLALRPDHLRADLDLADDWRTELDRAARAALVTAAGLELVVRLGEEPAAALDALAAALPAAQARVDRVLVLATDAAVSEATHVRLARERLSAAAPDAAFAAGTDLWFTELNRTRPDLEGVDGVFYSTAATVHANDDVSVMETPSALGDTVRSAQAIAGGRAVFVGPVTIRPRSWPFGALEGWRGLPYQVDPRQPALFGAAWTVAALKHLAEAGPAAVTLFETTGWRGVLERETGSPAPQAFRSRPGAVFCLYHVLADYGEWRRGGATVPARSARPLAVATLAVREGGSLHALVANLTSETQRCVLAGLDGTEASVRVLDETTAERAGDEPEAFRAERERRALEAGRLPLELRPYAVVRVDA